MSTVTILALFLGFGLGVLVGRWNPRKVAVLAHGLTVAHTAGGWLSRLWKWLVSLLVGAMIVFLFTGTAFAQGVTELLQVFGGTLDTAVLGAIGILLSTVGTQVAKVALNTEHWGPLRNPWVGSNTDRFMPVLALLIGAAYSWSTATNPGWADNLRTGLAYGAWAIVGFGLVKKTLMGR